MQKTTYYCDGCGAEKKEVNHWFVAWASDRGGLTIRTFGGLEDYQGLEKIYCGQRCVIAAVTKYMDQQTDSTEKRCRDSDHTDSTTTQ